MTLQSPTATLIPLFSSSELTGCGYPGLLDRKNRSDMCPRWESNPRLPACKASTLSTRPGSPLRLFADDTSLYIIVDDPTDAAITLTLISLKYIDGLVSFNPSKSESPIFSRTVNKPYHPPIAMNNQQVNGVSTHKHLSVHF